MSPSHDGVQISSDTVALALSGVALAVLLHTRVDSWTQVSASSAANQIELSVQTEAAATPSPPAPPPPKPVPRRVVPPVRVAEIPATTQPQLQASDPVPEGAALVAAATLPAPAPPDARPDLEAAYAAGLRADIDRRTHAPDSAQYRLRRPSGEVRVGFVVMRNGVAKIVRVLRSSGSSILDDAAQSTVSSGHYPPMPAQVFIGEAEHMFAVTIEFHRAN